ncbi:hypothetical protein Misp01_14600 [Microtetraspora sp. NBRC 13810]|uniref:phosphatase PAP2 family protein n=1 Tax=Microtetraspora sp. NBRC 13810 TaxID=3030990 RepID=UPI0024A34E16|nr:phosphatase PAP2 family protein [Microtetraspora sp. NBRC 13810]GLW06330.1 hypothetical protein Misp01_14600 [Microtetraspora sp. NBRC 13810]
MAALAAGVVAVVVNWPGGLGTTSAVRVESGPSASLYRWAAEAVAGGPDGFAGVLDTASAGALVLLGLLFAAGWWTARGRGAYAVATGILGGVGAVLGYAGSEALKLVVDEERPCRVLAAGLDLAAHCPPTGDWAFPSNHAAIAGGLAAGLVLLSPRLGAVAVPLAGLVAALRVLAGVHYPHDVLAGLFLGATVTTTVVLLCAPVAAGATNAFRRDARDSP